MTRRDRFAFGIGALALAAVACSGGSAAPEAEGEQAARLRSMPADADSVRRAPDDPSFAERERITVAGVRDAKGNCRLRRTFSMEPGEQHRSERVVEFREASCEYTIAVGRSTTEPAPQPGTARMTDTIPGS